MESPPIPGYVLRDLEIIDPAYYFEWDARSEGWFVRRKLVIDRHGLFIRNPRVGYYKDLDEAILDLKIRKREGVRLNLDRNPSAYLDEIKRRNKEAKERRIRENREFMAEGFMFAHKLSTSKTFDMGGHPNEKHS